MGSMFAIWDWIFGTHVIAGPQKELVLGLGDGQNQRFRTFSDNVVMPFIDVWHKVLRLPVKIKNMAVERK
jgi:hypothetical protein